MAMSDVVRLQDQINLIASKIADCAREVAGCVKLGCPARPG